MTTAGRPTFDAARGGTGKGEGDLSALSKHYSSRDLPGHTKLKYRQQGQGTSNELRDRDFRQELEHREQNITKPVPEMKRKAITADISTTTNSSKKQKLDKETEAINIDADDPIDNDSDDSSDDNDSDDDTAALLAELNKIKQERANDEIRIAEKKQHEEENVRLDNILSGNPLLNYNAGNKGALTVKRRWNDEVIFKNCARGEPDKKSNFINDTLRSEFHKKFMGKYIK